ncbi:unnamed protein product, partial [Lymnaea stagnalis]
SDVVIYNKCLKDNREKFPANANYRVSFVESFFPIDQDIERAGYAFCGQALLAAPSTYAVSPKKMLHCKKKVHVDRCEWEPAVKYNELFDAIYYNDTEWIQEVACDISYAYWACLRNQYTMCKREIRPMFNYYFARLGPRCLLRHSERNFIMLGEQCEHSPNDPTDPDSADRQRQGKGGCSRYLGRVELLLQCFVMTQAVFCLYYRPSVKKQEKNV